MNRRIKQIREYYKLTQKEFGAALGVSRDVISNIEGNRVNLRPVLLNHVCELFSINKQWIYTGEGNMIEDTLTEDKQMEKLTNLFSELSPELKNFILEQLEVLISLQNKQN